MPLDPHAGQLSGESALSLFDLRSVVFIVVVAVAFALAGAFMVIVIVGSVPAVSDSGAFVSIVMDAGT